MLELLRSVVGVESLHVHDGQEGLAHVAKSESMSSLPTLLMGMGDCPWTSERISTADLSQLPSESFRIVAYREQSAAERHVLLSNGQRLHHGYKSKDVATPVHYGAIAGAYHTLELLGFAFLHPLSPIAPSVIGLSLPRSGLDLTEAPHWPIRIFHHHTQHPLELTEVMQGLDVPMFGPLGPNCVRPGNVSSSAGARAASGRGVGSARQGEYCERWEDMVGDMDRLFEWAIANKYNRVEWLLLGNYKWKGFDNSETRRKRLKILCHLGHQYGLLVGADVPLGNVQQHGWYMVNPRLPYSKQVLNILCVRTIHDKVLIGEDIYLFLQVDQIRHRVDWVLGAAGFDFMTTESGLSEFTYPDCSLMRDLLEEFSTYVNETWGREALVKVHCSPGQTCGDFSDPRNGEPVNFNHLPMFVHGSMGVMPHTVQVCMILSPLHTYYT